ncbi:hypothetical protein GCM10020331_044090 [Ectobacillus funiculus]
MKVKAYQKGGDEAVVTVKDSGVGMDKEQLARLGQPYYSLKEKGTGLGLMVTFSIIQAHQGKKLPTKVKKREGNRSKYHLADSSAGHFPNEKKLPRVSVTFFHFYYYARSGFARKMFF